VKAKNCSSIRLWRDCERMVEVKTLFLVSILEVPNVEVLKALRNKIDFVQIFSFELLHTTAYSAMVNTYLANSSF
jgi:hypothetical protein